MSNTCRFEELFAAPLRNGVSYPAKLRGRGIPMINMKEIFAYDRIADQVCELVPLTAAERESCLLESGDLLFARQSLTYDGAGKCVVVMESDQERTWESHLIRVRLDTAKASAGYYFYYFRSPQGRGSMETIIQQVAAAGIRGSDLRRLLVPRPSVNEQRAIADLLGALDDKIAANAKLAATADELVRALYAQLTAGTEERIQLADLAFQPKVQVDPGVLGPDSVYVGLEHIPRRMMWLDAMGCAADVSSAKSVFEEGDVLFGKLRPYFHKVVAAPVRGICSTDVLVVRPIDAKFAGFILASVSSDPVVDRCTASSEGTRMPRTNWKDLAAVKVPWPGPDEALTFSERVLDLRKVAEARIRESGTLAAMRDAILPQLMSGHLRIKGVEQLVGDVV